MREIESELERSVKLKEYYDSKSVLTLSEVLEDNINLRMESHASLSGNGGHLILVVLLLPASRAVERVGAR